MQKEITNLLELPNDYEYITNDIIKKFYTKNINKIIEENTNVFSVFHYNSISLLTQKDGVSYWMVREIFSDKTAVINSNKEFVLPFDNYGLLGITKDEKYILCYHNDGEALFDFDGKIIEGHFEANKNQIPEDKVVKKFVTQIKNDDSEKFLGYKETIDFFEDNKYTVKINTQKLEQSYFSHSIFDYKESKFFTNGRNKRYFALCKKDSGKWGLVNARGELIVPFKYDDLGTFVDCEGDFIHIEVEGKYGLIDCLGNIVIKPIYDDIIRFFDGLALVEQNKKFGYIDTSGNVAIPMIYDSATDFEFARAIVTLDNRTFCINRYGEEIKIY